jgi:hypothetical protein
MLSYVAGHERVNGILLQCIVSILGVMITCSHLLTLVPRSRIFLFFSSTLKMEAIRSSETTVYTISTRRHVQEDGILHIHCRENLKS